MILVERIKRGDGKAVAPFNFCPNRTHLFPASLNMLCLIEINRSWSKWNPESEQREDNYAEREELHKLTSNHRVL